MTTLARSLPITPLSHLLSVFVSFLPQDMMPEMPWLVEWDEGWEVGVETELMTFFFFSLPARRATAGGGRIEYMD